MALNERRGPDAGTAGPGAAGADESLADLAATDELLSSIGAGRPVQGDPLATLLADWRAELHAEPMPALPSDADVAAAYAPNVTPLARHRAVRGSRSGHHHGRRPGLAQSLAGAAAVVTVLVGGVSIAAHDAKPGDPLWGVTKTIFTDKAGDVELVGDLTQDLAAADAAAQKGDRATAERILTTVSARLEGVSDAEDRVELMKRRDAIERELKRITPSQVPSPTAPSPTTEESTAAPAPIPVNTSAAEPTPVPLPVTKAPVSPPPSSMPVIPLPLDGLQISTTLQIPVDTQAIQDYLYPTTGAPRPEGTAVPVPTGPAAGAGGPGAAGPSKHYTSDVPTATPDTPRG